MIIFSLFIISCLLLSLGYRLPLSVKEVRRLGSDGYFPVCPKCNRTIEREYQSYCDRCGQKLNWDKFI